jgi:hypothetical protein
LAGLHVERDGEAAAAARGACDIERAAHELHQLAADRKAEPGALDMQVVLPHLLEGREYPFELLGRDANARILDLESQPAVPDRGIVAVHAEVDHAAPRELDGVAEQVQENLAELPLIGDDRGGQSSGGLEAERQAALHGAHARDVTDVAQERVEVELCRIELELARLDLGEIQHLADQVEQVLAAALDRRHPLGTRGAEIGVALQQLCVAEDPVQRRAQLVAHVGEKLALRTARALGGVAGALQRRSASRRSKALATISPRRPISRTSPGQCRSALSEWKPSMPRALFA